MTSRQKIYYWRLWRDVCGAKEWHMAGGKLAWNPQKLCSRSANLVEIAGQLAELRDGNVVLDDLRHAAHIAVLGVDKSSKRLSNGDFNRIRAFFGVLVDPDNLTAVMEHNNPKLAERRGLVHFIRRRAPEAYIRDIAADRFGTKDWENLALTDLRQLSMTLANRRARWNRGVSNSGPAVVAATGNVPF